MSLNLRASARAIILGEDDHVLLCRFVFPTRRSRTEHRPSGLLQVAA
jgi:hypothetical protein